MGHDIKTKLPFRDNASSRADNAMEIIDPGSQTGVCFERASSRTAVANNDDRTGKPIHDGGDGVVNGSGVVQNEIYRSTRIYEEDNRLLPKHRPRIQG